MAARIHAIIFSVLLCTFQSMTTIGLICAYNNFIIQRVTHSHFIVKKTETKIGQIVYLILRFNHLKDSFEEFNFLKIHILRNLIVL